MGMRFPGCSRGLIEAPMIYLSIDCRTSRYFPGRCRGLIEAPAVSQIPGFPAPPADSRGLIEA